MKNSHRLHGAKLAPRGITLVLAFAAAASSADAQQRNRDDESPIVLKTLGSFFVGGTKTLIQFSAGPANNRPGHIMKDAMYVQYKIPMGRLKPNVVLWSGGCHVGTSFETTPDGREGWELMFVRAGYPTYVVDATWRGRSQISQNDIQAVRNLAADPTTLPRTLTCDEELAAPPTPLGTGFRLYGSNFPIQALDQYLSQMVPDFFFSAQNGFVPNKHALIELLEKIGPSIVLAHSQGGSSVYPTVIERPDLFRAYLAVEALGSCGLITDTYPNVPTLIVSGDRLDPSRPYPFGLAGCRTKAATRPNMTVWYLPEDLGIHGNSHMMMMDTNNEEVFQVLEGWIRRHVPR